MRRERNKFIIQRTKVRRYNKAIIYTFTVYILYSIFHSLLMLDCRGIDYYNETGKISVEKISCSHLFPGLLAFFRNNNITICCVIGVIGLLFLILQKITLFKINKLNIRDLNEEKVKKYPFIVLTLLFGYTGIHKFKTGNNKIGYIYLANFIVYIIAQFIKIVFVSTYNKELIFYCTFKFSLIMLIGIIIYNIVEEIFALISFKDVNDRIFA